MKQLIEFGFLLTTLLLFHGCYTIVFVDEKDQSVYDSPAPSVQPIIDYVPAYITEPIFIIEPQPEPMQYRPSATHTSEHTAGVTTHLDERRLTQTGRSQINQSAQPAIRNDNEKSSRDMGIKRSGR
jgi:hypothetical protein